MRFTEEQIIKVIKQHEAGAKVDVICRDMGISAGKFYNWRSKFAGLEVNEAQRLSDAKLRALTCKEIQKSPE